MHGINVYTNVLFLHTNQTGNKINHDESVQCHFLTILEHKRQANVDFRKSSIQTHISYYLHHKCLAIRPFHVII